MSRRYNLRRIKLEYSYSAIELAHLLHVNIGTVRRWVAQGLEPIDHHWPQLFRGDQIASFLRGRMQARVSLGPGEIYCFSCKGPRLPRDSLIRLAPRSLTTVDFIAPCGCCGTEMFRRVRRSEIGAKIGTCAIALEDDQMTMSGNVESLRMSSCEEMAA